MEVDNQIENQGKNNAQENEQGQEHNSSQNMLGTPKKEPKPASNLNHVSPEISPRAVHIENYQSSRNARNTFIQTSTLKNLESGNLKNTYAQKIASPQKNKSAQIKLSLSGSGFKDSSKSNSIRGGVNQNDSNLLRASSAGREMSERVAQRLEEHKKAVEENKTNGKEALVATLHKKELENHVKILENRIMRLQVEENNLQKKINHTSNKTEKTLESKLRHQDDLMTKQERKNTENQKLEQKRSDLNNHREVVKVTLKQKSDLAYKKRLDTATSVKDIKKEAQNQRKENFDKFHEKSTNLIQKIRNDDKTAKTQRFDKENQKKQQKNDEFQNRISTHKEDTEKLEDKLRELEEKEQMLIEKIKQTYSLHKSKYNEYQKVFQAKVDPNTPIDVNAIRSSDQNQHEEGEDAGAYQNQENESQA